MMNQNKFFENKYGNFFDNSGSQCDILGEEIISRNNIFGQEGIMFQQ